MSLKATKNALWLLTSTAEAGSVAHDLVALARKEIAALEKAAKHFVDQNLYQTLAVSDDFELLMEAIAKEAE